MMPLYTENGKVITLVKVTAISWKERFQMAWIILTKGRIFIDVSKV